MVVTAALRPTAIRAMQAQRGAFRASAPAMAVKPQFQPHVARFTPETVFKWLPALAFWGAGAAGAVTLFFSPVPLFQADVLRKVPVVGAYFEDKTPDSDKPF